MKKNSKLRTSLIIYAMILYGLWSLLELYLKNQIGIDEFTKEVYIKLVFWLLPAIVIHFRFSDNMFIKKEEMYLITAAGSTTSSAGGLSCPLQGHVAFPPKGGLTNHVHYVTGGRLKAALLVT